MTTWDTILYVVLGTLLFVLAILIWRFKMFKYKVRIREVVNGRRLIIDDKAREIKEDGASYWYLMKRREKLPLPPPEAIDLTTKGHKVVEVYRTESGDYTYLQDTNYRTKDNFEPLTTEERLMLIEEITKANSMKKQNIWEFISHIAPIASVIIIVAILVFGYGEIARPLTDVSSNQANIAKQQAALMESIRDIIQNRQTIPINTPTT